MMSKNERDLWKRMVDRMDGDRCEWWLQSIDTWFTATDDNEKKKQFNEIREVLVDRINDLTIEAIEQDAEAFDIDVNIPCQLCPGEADLIGALGPVKWYRCRMCGIMLLRNERRSK